MTRRWCPSILLELQLQRRDVEGLGAFCKDAVPQMIGWRAASGPAAPPIPIGL